MTWSYLRRDFLPPWPFALFVVGHCTVKRASSSPMRSVPKLSLAPAALRSIWGSRKSGCLMYRAWPYWLWLTNQRSTTNRPQHRQVQLQR